MVLTSDRPANESLSRHTLSLLQRSRLGSQADGVTRYQKSADCRKWIVRVRCRVTRSDSSRCSPSDSLNRSAEAVSPLPSSSSAPFDTSVSDGCSFRLSPDHCPSWMQEGAEIPTGRHRYRCVVIRFAIQAEWRSTSRSAGSRRADIVHPLSSRSYLIYVHVSRTSVSLLGGGRTHVLARTDYGKIAHLDHDTIV